MLCSGDPDMDLTREVVGSAGHPDTHRLVAQKGRYRPDWDYEKHPHSARMVHRQIDEQRSQFWETLTTMIG